MLKKITLLFKHVRSFFPSRLPVGMTEMNKWLDDIVELSGPIANERDMHFVLCSILIHADVKHGSLPKRYFVTRLIKSAANQIASQIFQTIKLEQAAEVEAAKATIDKPKVADTAYLESAVLNAAAQKITN